VFSYVDDLIQLFARLLRRKPSARAATAEAAAVPVDPA